MIIRKVERRTHVEYYHVFRSIATGREYLVACDANGRTHTLTERIALGDFQADPAYRETGVRSMTFHTTIPALLRCECGCDLEIPSSTNTCRCGREYNSFGQRLAPRSQWGEETGETLSDILIGSGNDA